MKQISIALIFIGSSMTFAMAQQEMPLEMQATHKETRNMLGLLEFCQTKGVSDAEATGYLKKSSRVYDDLIGSSKGDEAESTGRAGVVAGRGLVRKLSEIASEQHKSIVGVCRELVGSYKAKADEFAKQTGEGTGIPRVKETK
jgi:hypothetical protein